MTALFASVVDPKELGQTVLAAFVAGIGVTIVFSLAVLGAARSLDARRDERRVAAAAFAALGVLGLLATFAAVATGLIVMTSG